MPIFKGFCYFLVKSKVFIRLIRNFYIQLGIECSICRQNIKFLSITHRKWWAKTLGAFFFFFFLVTRYLDWEVADQTNCAEVDIRILSFHPAHCITLHHITSHHIKVQSKSIHLLVFSIFLVHVKLRVVPAPRNQPSRAESAVTWRTIFLQILLL